MNFAVIKNNIVTNVIIADSLEIAELVTGATCVKSDVAAIGAAYDEETGLFITPDPIVEDPS